MRRSTLLRASSSQSICNFCARRVNSHARQTSLARSHGFHSTAAQSQDPSDPFGSFELPDAALEAQRALQEAKRQREEQEAVRRRLAEEMNEKASSQRLFASSQDAPPSESRSDQQQQQQQQSGQPRQQSQTPQLQSQRQPDQPRQQSHQKRQPRQNTASPRPVDPSANRPLNRVQTAQRDGRGNSRATYRSTKGTYGNVITRSDFQNRSAMPSLDVASEKASTSSSSPTPKPTSQPAPTPKPAPRPQFKTQSPTVQPPSWVSAAPTPKPTASASIPARNPHVVGESFSQPSQSIDEYEDIFSADLNKAREAFQSAAANPPTMLNEAHLYDESASRISGYAEDRPETTRDYAMRKWQEEQESRQETDEQAQRVQEQRQSASARKGLAELASSIIKSRPKITMESNVEELQSRTQDTQTSEATQEASDLSQEEEQMLAALLARKNKTSATPTSSPIDSLFDEQDQQTRNALIVQSKQRVAAEQARKEEQERRLSQNRGPRFSTTMVKSRSDIDETPFENAQNWDILKSRQQRSKRDDAQTQPARQAQESRDGGRSRYTPMSVGDIDARFEEYRKKRPQFSAFNIESLDVQRKPFDTSRPPPTCVRCGQPGHFFRNCPNQPKPGWVDRRTQPQGPDRNGERSDRFAERYDRQERQAREPRNAGRDMAAAHGVDKAAADPDAEDDEAARKISERNARRASRFVEEDEDDAPRAARTKGRRGRELEDEDEDDRPSRGRRSRFDDDDEDIEGNFGAMREARDARKKARQAKKDKAAKEAARQAARQARRAEAMTPINLPEFVSVSKLAQLTNVTYQELVEKMEELGFENTSHDHVLSAEEAGLIAMEYNFDPDQGAREEAEAEERDLKALPELAPEDKEYLPARPPVVAIMGHVDHGKTTILDYLRKSSIAATEHGGITQHIGAFSVALSSGKTITFLDTPGHAAFLEMRKRGANVTDIIILVVAADDSVKPQTIEAIKHAQSAQVPIIVAVNKIDKEEANVDRVKQDLARHGVEIEDFGGDTQVVPVSGKTGQGIDELEDAAVTLSEILDHRADTEGQVEGWVIEATTKDRGRVATVLVRRGTLRTGSIIVAGKTWARVRSLRNEAGIAQMSAGPGTPIEVDGWRDQPSAGDEVLQAPTEQKASDVVAYREEKEERIRMAEDMEKINIQRREQQVLRDAAKEAAAAEKAAKQQGIELESTAPRREAVDENATPGHQSVPFIIKADVSGSVEAVSAYLLQMSNSLCSPTILRASVGPVSEFDIEHADAAGGHIISFNLPSDPEFAGRAERKGIKILEQNVIYRIVDDVRAVLEEKLPPQKIQKVTGEAEVAMSFEIGIGGRKKMKIAGLKIRNGVVSRGSRVRVMRGEDKIYDGTVTSLKNVKKDVQEMRKGTECGMGFDGWESFEVGDMIQTFDERTEKRTLPL